MENLVDNIGGSDLTNPIYDDNINMLVPYYLMYSYLYYEENESIVPDAEYDRICKTLYEKWNDIEHRHKNLIDKDTLLAGTGFQLKYPEMVKGAAKRLMKESK